MRGCKASWQKLETKWGKGIKSFLERLLSFVTTSRFGIGLNGWAETIWQLCPGKICVLCSCKTTPGVTQVVDVEFMVYDEYEYMINEEEFD